VADSREPMGSHVWGCALAPRGEYDRYDTSTDIE